MVTAATRAQELYGRPWIEREYIVALDSYFANREAPRHIQSPYIKDLSNLLGRTAASIVMRMENFASLDPDEQPHRRGLVNISPICRRVFDKWKDNPSSLRDCAEVYAREIAGGQPNNLSLFEANVLLPRAFGKYDLLDQLGEGGFGSVFSCVNPDSQQRFALKIIKADRVFDSEGMHRFRREIKILRSIEHPNLIRLHEDNLDTEDAYPGFVMDLGVTNLLEYMQRQPDQGGRPVLPGHEAAFIWKSVLDAISALHSHSPAVIHRDINPSNVLQMGDGRWVLADFGLAKFVGGTPMSFATMTRSMCGTTYFAAPEQYRDLKLTDERTDVYGLGVLLWELFSTEWPPPVTESSGLPPQLDLVFRRTQARSPAQRYQTVKELAADAIPALASIVES
ncbi:MAG TPA: serine/threonine-protein kinase [Bryobacteraceae bacterium]|nr:serine/threonine-protein kinase [Bryobacteraceae bacterium]